MGKTCVLKVMNDNENERDIVFRLGSQSAANALYRCITEMHSFFCCDTVHNEVSSQFSRDLKGTLASLFNEKTTLGRLFSSDSPSSCMHWYCKNSWKTLLFFYFSHCRR